MLIPVINMHRIAGACLYAVSMCAHVFTEAGYEGLVGTCSVLSEFCFIWEHESSDWQRLQCAKA